MIRTDNPDNHDRPLSFHWHAPDLSRELGLPPLPGRLERVRSSFFAEAILAHEANQWVSYSRNRNFYSAGHRYRSTDFTYRNVCATADNPDNTIAIENYVVPPGNLTWQSSFRAKPKLMEVWGDLSRSLTYDVGETILLKDGDGKLIDYADTRFTRRVRTEIARTNELLAGVKIDVPCEWRGHHMLIDESYVLPVPGNPLRRIYGRGSFSMGGRAYGWWQNIPKGARAQMTINGESVAEADYSAMHATMLYNRVGIRFVGDPYDVDGYERSEVKHGFNIALNAKNRWAAIGALAREIGKSKKYCAKLLKAILHKHKAIERYFCSDVGMKLMNADSQLILSALRAVNRAGEIALPVHDALVIPARIADFAAAKMVESFEQVFGVVSPCYVKVKP